MPSHRPPWIWAFEVSIQWLTAGNGVQESPLDRAQTASFPKIAIAVVAVTASCATGPAQFSNENPPVAGRRPVSAHTSPVVSMPAATVLAVQAADDEPLPDPPPHPATNATTTPTARTFRTAETMPKYCPLPFRIVLTDEVARTYEVETAFDDVMPTRVLTLTEARAWLEELCRAEDIDTPMLDVARMGRATEAVAIPEEWCVLVSDVAPTQHTLLHELAHLSCANRGHGREFRTQLVRYVRRYVSVEHAAWLHAKFVDSGLSIDPFAATR